MQKSRMQATQLLFCMKFHFFKYVFLSGVRKYICIFISRIFETQIFPQRPKVTLCAGAFRGEGAPVPPEGLHGGRVQEPRRTRQQDEGQVSARQTAACLNPRQKSTP
jgi:hypothetical protein